ncbi:GLPGLI family protein [Paenimyroides viscosum]|uniref:GLPGLI family protein n=1 Tax=Paenimyroides viscosum TaxID=2488729 RepID=A0A3P1B6P3_9FLAO|nr:GLPGLI family protein [Paenimyroides viscosum]RRA96810.1 GLPGLI family protein [Paenimyroides viscosum]
MLKYSLFFFCFFYFYSFSQQIQVEYFENRIVKNPEEIKKLPEFLQKDFEPNRFGYTLTYSDGVSTYENKDFSVLLNTSTEPTTEEVDLGNGEKMTFVGTFNDTAERYRVFEKKIFKDYLNKKIYAELFINDKKEIIDDFFDWNWDITDEKKEINGYVCTKAISKIMGHHFEAWYSEEIPISAGPEKFDGLPGLILYLRVDAMEYIASSVKFLDAPIVLNKPNYIGRIYTFEELIKNSKTNFKQFENKIEKIPNTNNYKRTISY